MAEIRDYSTTADDNDASSPNGMANGCAPSTVNDTWREGVARMKRWYEDAQGSKTTGGSSNAYTLAASRTVASYAAGDCYVFKANHTCTSAGSTLNVDSVAAKAIVTPAGAAIGAGGITSGGVYMVAYEASVEKFMLIGGSHSGGDNPFIYNSSPTLTLENSTSEDTSGGRESQVVFKGLQSGSEESTLVKITASHEGTSDDQKGQLVVGVNDGDDDDAPTTAITVASTGNVTFSQDLTVSDDVKLASDAAVLGFGANNDVTITHVHDSGLTLKNTSTGDDTPFVFTLQTGETDIALNDYLGRIFFQAPDETAGTDAIVVAAEISALSEGDFAADNNATSLSFATASSGSPTQKMVINSAGKVGIGTGASASIVLYVYNNETGKNVAQFTQDNASSTSNVINVSNDGEGYGIFNVNANGSGIYTTASRGTGGYFVQDAVVASNYGVYAQGASNYGVYGRTLHSSYGAVIGYDHDAGGYGIMAYQSIYAFYGSGIAYASGGHTGSDERLKDVSGRVSKSDGILNKVKQLSPVYFKWKENTEQYKSGGKADQPVNFGLLAQEVEELFPHLVLDHPVPKHFDPDDPSTEINTDTINAQLGTTKGIAYEKMVGYLAVAIQELSDKNDALEARIAVLESA